MSKQDLEALSREMEALFKEKGESLQCNEKEPCPFSALSDRLMEYNRRLVDQVRQDMQLIRQLQSSWNRLN